MSEGERLLKATNNIIAKITKYASSLIELHGNMINRKEEYKYLCHLFDNQTTLEDAHTLAGTIIGVDTVRHFKGISKLNSDSIIPSLEVAPTIIDVEPMSKKQKAITTRVPIIDKTLEKEKILKEYEENERKQKELLKNLIKTGTINLTGEVHLTKDERNYILNLIAKANASVTTDPIFGYNYKINEINTPCKIICDDGTFYMSGLLITIGGEVNG